MPLYEYECESCQHVFERIQKFSDPLVDTCPKCGGKVRKLLSSPAIQFKGSGWYITDYARKGGDASKPADGKTDARSDSKAETKPESTSDSKSDAKPGTSTASPSKSGAESS